MRPEIVANIIKVVIQLGAGLACIFANKGDSGIRDLGVALIGSAIGSVTPTPWRNGFGNSTKDLTPPPGA